MRNNLDPTRNQIILIYLLRELCNCFKDQEAPLQAKDIITDSKDFLAAIQNKRCNRERVFQSTDRPALLSSEKRKLDPNGLAYRYKNT